MTAARHVACYLRVSTDEQTADNQEPEARALADAVAVRLGVSVVTYRDQASGIATTRPGWDRLRAELDSRRVGAVVVWALDRASRKGMIDVLSFVRACRDRGAELHSVREPWLATSGPIGDVIVAILAWAAEHERERLRERTRAGVARVKRSGSASGLSIGRPRVPESALAEAAAKCRRERGRSFHRGREVWVGVEAAAASTFWEQPGPKGVGGKRVPVSVTSLRRYLKTRGG